MWLVTAPWPRYGENIVLPDVLHDYLGLFKNFFLNNSRVKEKIQYKRLLSDSVFTHLTPSQHFLVQQRFIPVIHAKLASTIILVNGLLLPSF